MIEVDDYKSWVWISSDGFPRVLIGCTEYPIENIVNNDYFKSREGLENVKNWLLDNFGHHDLAELEKELPWVTTAINHAAQGRTISCIALTDQTGLNIINQMFVLGY